MYRRWNIHDTSQYDFSQTNQQNEGRQDDGTYAQILGPQRTQSALLLVLLQRCNLELYGLKEAFGNSILDLR